MFYQISLIVLIIFLVILIITLSDINYETKSIILTEYSNITYRNVEYDAIFKYNLKYNIHNNYNICLNKNNVKKWQFNFQSNIENTRLPNNIYNRKYVSLNHIECNIDSCKCSITNFFNKISDFKFGYEFKECPKEHDDFSFFILALIIITPCSLMLIVRLGEIFGFVNVGGREINQPLIRHSEV